MEAGMTMTSQIVKAAVLPSMQVVKNSHGQDGGGKEELQVTTVCLPIAKGESDVIVQDSDREVGLKDKRQVVPVVLLGIERGALAKTLEALMATIDQLEMPVSFELLKQTDMWICDTGASTHSSYNKEGATNERQTGSASLGHVGTAVNAECTVDVPGRFVTRNGSLGINATLQGVSYNREHNFNLLSLMRLL